MATTVTISSVIPVDATQNEFIVYGTIVLSGSYTTTGDIINFSTFSQIPSNAVPVWIDVTEQPPAGTSPTGYLFIFCPGTTPANGRLAIFNNITEFSAGAYSAGLLAAVIKFQMFIQSFV